ncbi:hypothetical protein GCM10010299_42460 [Streptomyces tanashiensis]|nr:hypothetical protein GCM10010299_42460 [Streptomyces tanashiensis]
MEYPAASRVIPRDSRSRLSWEPSRMRRTTLPLAPLDSPAVTALRLPYTVSSPRRAPDSAIKRFSAYTFDYGKAATSGHPHAH